jgi:hypothetical protein
MNKLIRCKCYSSEHIMIVDEDLEDKLIYVHIHLSKKTLWKRFKHAVKYIFGYQCRFGAFDEMILDKENTEDLYEMLKRIHNE